MNINKFPLMVIVGILATAICTQDSSANTKNQTLGQTMSIPTLAGGTTTNIGRIGLVSKDYVSSASSTANYFYKLGMKHYEKGNLDKAEKAFQAVLRADGLDLEATHFLALIGVKHFENRHWEKAETAFQAVLRADGFDIEATHYLAVISDKIGNAANTQKYIAAYNKLSQ